MQISERHKEYWRRNMNITMVLAAIWFVSTFGISYFARELATISFFGWPLSFYMSAQGTLVIYLVIIGYYAIKMRKLDLEYDVAEGEE